MYLDFVSRSLSPSLRTEQEKNGSRQKSDSEYNALSCGQWSLYRAPLRGNVDHSFSQYFRVVFHFSNRIFKALHQSPELTGIMLTVHRFSCFAIPNFFPSHLPVPIFMLTSKFLLKYSWFSIISMWVIVIQLISLWKEVPFHLSRCLHHSEYFMKPTRLLTHAELSSAGQSKYKFYLKRCQSSLMAGPWMNFF